ncbi:unnamed protein product [Aphanomyces euteiches]
MWKALSLQGRCMSAYTAKVVGAEGTDAARFVIQKGSQVLSPWHDIPLRPVGETAKNVFNFINEIPKGTRAKMEIATAEQNNPIKQDVKKGNLRFYHFDSLVNYGCIPQTWEDPAHIDPATHRGGDNDPIDVCEIGSRVAAVGEVYPVKALGVLGMIDDGETDWKVIAIALDDPMAKKLNGAFNLAGLSYVFIDIEDLLLYSPNTVPSILKWFRDYKIPDGKPPSLFAFDGRAMSKDFTIDVIEQTHDSWKQLVASSGGSSKLWTRK